MIAGVFAIWLGAAKYTESLRRITIGHGFISFCTIAFSMTFESPNGILELFAAILAITLPAYIWLVAWRVLPQNF